VSVSAVVASEMEASEDDDDDDDGGGFAGRHSALAPVGARAAAGPPADRPASSSLALPSSSPATPRQRQV